MMSHSITLPILLQLVGVLVVIAEVILPSGGILSLIAIGLFGYSLFLVFTEFSTSLGALFVVVDIITIPILVVIGLKLLAKSPATLRGQLSRSRGVSSQDPDLENYLGKEGITLTALHPAGTAMIDGRRLDVVSRGDYIEKGSAIVVGGVTGNQIIVRKK